MNSSVPLLELQHLSCEREDRPLFADINYPIVAGDVVQILGPNGAGKTTLLRVLAQLNTEYTGELRYQGKSINANPWDFKQNSLYIGHLAGIKKALTPTENLNWYCSQFPSSKDVNAALAKVGLEGFEDTPCYQLSAGQVRRVALARLYLSAAKVWLLDEPFTAIDKRGVAELEQLIVNHALAGGVVILTSHQDLSNPNVKSLNLAQYQPRPLLSSLSGDWQ